MHQSIISTAPHPKGRAGYSGENVLGFYFKICIVPAVPVLLGFCFLVENTGITVAHGKTMRGQIAVVLPTVCPRSVGLIAEIFWTKSQRSPRESRGGGGRGYMTGAIQCCFKKNCISY